MILNIENIGRPFDEVARRNECERLRFKLADLSRRQRVGLLTKASRKGLAVIDETNSHVSRTENLQKKIFFICTDQMSLL